MRRLGQAGFAGPFRLMATDEILVLGFKLWSQWNCFLGALGLLWSLPTVIGSWVGLRRPEHILWKGLGLDLPRNLWSGAASRVCRRRGQSPLLEPSRKGVR